ncbi:ribonuclease HI [Treponema sp. HNW]|uniref:ribonuclease HI n=1 Tax=Treponema sp. HNW TaxID=3116654 RepID=UPI003D1088AE
MKKINWGIIGAGNIASSFVKALAENPDAALYAVASRDKDRAGSFARRYGFSKVYAGADAYVDLCTDKKIDAVYIATPHTNHAELSLHALKAGNAVLCEKPAAVNAAQLQSVLEYSASHKVFYMEAMWMKFNPAVRRALESLRGGVVGQLLEIKADFYINVPYDINHRLYNPLLAGGALLDTGIYPVTFAMLAASCVNKEAGFYEGAVLPPSRILSSLRKAPSGVDMRNALSAEWDLPSGMLCARLCSGNDIEGRNFFNDALLCGTKGKIILRDFWRAEEVEYYDEKNNLIKKEQYPFRVNGYEYEIEEMHRCMREGLCESPFHRHRDTVCVMRTLDGIRSQWGLIYPCESGSVSAAGKKAEAGSEKGGISLYSDGACSGNPGPGGWAAVILHKGKIITAQGGEKPTTNNRMELSGAIGALEKLFTIPEAKNEKIGFYIDSQYVKNGITSWIHTWKQNGWRTSDKKPVKNKDLWEKLDLYTQQFKIQWCWVKGHAGNTYNELCDRLAVEERDKRS